jgi:hypothetical protein
LVNVLVPAALVPSLRIPDLAVTTGTPDVVWCERSCSPVRWSRRHIVHLPYDPAAAARLRKHARLGPVYTVVVATYLLLAILWFVYHVRPSIAPLGLSGAMFVLSILNMWWDAPPKPVRTGVGDLYLPNLPAAVAQQWIERNPGVRAVDRMPTYRRYRPRVYVVAAVVCMLAAIVTGGIVVDGADRPIELGFLPLAGLVAAATLTYLALPTGHTRLGNDTSL